MHQKVAGSVLGKGTYLGCRFNPWLGYVLEATGACFSLTLMFLSLSQINKHIFGENCKKI